MALREISDVFGNVPKVVLCGERKTSATFSEDAWQFSRQGAALWTVILRGRRSTLDVSCCVFFANRIGRAASSRDKVQISWQALKFCEMC